MGKIYVFLLAYFVFHDKLCLLGFAPVLSHEIFPACLSLHIAVPDRPLDKQKTITFIVAKITFTQ